MYLRSLSFFASIRLVVKSFEPNDKQITKNIKQYIFVLYIIKRILVAILGKI